MADEEGELPMFIEDDEEEAAAAAKAAAERQKRREEGATWGLDKIMDKYWEWYNERMREYGAHSRVVVVPPLDREEESPAPPMRYLPLLGGGGPQLASSVNILSIRVLRSAIGYPIDLYGTVFVRDELDRKRVCVFRRDRHNCQRISSQDDLLSLTGPYRGLLVFDKIYFEFDLMSKDCGAGNDTELGKWCVKDGALASTSKPIRNSFVGKLCSIDLTYAPARRAVEVAFQFKICDIFTAREKSDGSTTVDWVPFNKKRKEHSEFHGNITIFISGVHQDIVLYDSKAAGCVTGVDVDDGGLLKLSRHVFAVPIDREVSLKIVPHDGCHFALTTFPRIGGGSSSENIVGTYNLEVKLVWSALFSPMVCLMGCTALALLKAAGVSVSVELENGVTFVSEHMV